MVIPRAATNRITQKYIVKEMTLEMVHQKIFNTKGGSNGRIEKRKRLIHTETKDQNG